MSTLALLRRAGRASLHHRETYDAIKRQGRTAINQTEPSNSAATCLSELTDKHFPHLMKRLVCGRYCYAPVFVRQHKKDWAGINTRIVLLVSCGEWGLAGESLVQLGLCLVHFK
jgi:hypothetical protein